MSCECIPTHYGPQGQPVPGKAPMILPQYLLTDTGYEFESFEDVTEWVINAGAAADNPVEYRTGTQSIKMTTGVGTSATITKTLGAPVSFTDGTRARIYFYIHDLANISTIRFYMVATPWTDYFETAFVILDGWPWHSGWNAVEVFKSEWIDHGDWSNAITTIRVLVTPQPGVACSVSFDSVVVDLEGVPAFMWTFDDADDSIYTDAFPVLESRLARATFYITTDFVGLAGNVTSANLVKLDAYGWSIANHSDDITDLTTIPQAQVETKLVAARAALDGWGLTDASSHLAWPSCAFNDTTIAAAQNVSMLTARACKRPYSPILDAYGDQLLAWPIYLYVTNATSLATMTGMIDEAIADGKLVIFQCHRVGAGGDITAANFEALADYIIASHVPFITAKDMYDLLSGPVTVPFWR